MIKKIAYLAALVGATLAGQVGAATTWTLGTGTVSGTGDSPAVTASVQGGYANTVGTNTANNGYSQTIAAGTVTLYSGGLGIRNADWNSSTPADVDTNENASTPLPEHAIDNEQRYQFLNGYAESVLGVDTQAAIGRTIKEVRNPAFYAAIAPHVATAIGACSRTSAAIRRAARSVGGAGVSQGALNTKRVSAARSALRIPASGP